MKKFAILAKPGASTFVKDYDYYLSQGGLTQKWGKYWDIIEAKDIDDARVEAIRRSAFAGLYCAKCGKDTYKCLGHRAAK